jgi:hypothetical protein
MKKFIRTIMIVFGVILSVSAMAASAGIISPDALLTIGGSSSIAGSVIVTELDAKFGTYISNNKKKIYKLIQQPTESEKYMTTMAKTITEYRAALGVMTDVVQGFSDTYNDKGQLDVTPIVIKNYQHKVNVSIKPSEVRDSWIGYLADNEKQPKDMPLIQYIIQEHLLPKINSNRELKLIGKGVYDAAHLEVTGNSMNGFVTILKTLKASGTSNANFIALNDLTKSNIVAETEKFVDAIDLEYQGIEMPILCDPALHKMYMRGYRDAYGPNSDYKAGDKVDFSNNRMVPLPSMAGTGVMFATPKSNFIRLINRADGATNLWTEPFEYTVKVFADWWEGVGFAVEEAIFAYVPDAGSGSGSGV